MDKKMVLEQDSQWNLSISNTLCINYELSRCIKYHVQKVISELVKKIEENYRNKQWRAKLELKHLE